MDFYEKDFTDLNVAMKKQQITTPHKIYAVIGTRNENFNKNKPIWDGKNHIGSFQHKSYK